MIFCELLIVISMWNDSAVAYFRAVCYPDVLLEALRKGTTFPY